MQHQSQCSIFADQRFKISNIFLCSSCFRPTSTWLSFRCWPTLINPFTDCFYWAKLPTFFRKFCNNCSVSKTKFPLCLDPTFIFIRYFTDNQSYRPNCVYDLKYWRIYYNAIIAMLHVNIKIRTSQQRCSCCSVTLIIKSTFCSVVKFVLEVSVSVNLTYVK